MTALTRESPRPVCRALAASLLIATVLLAASWAHAGARWTLIYCRQVGNNLNQNCQTMETHVLQESGAKAYHVGVTNQSNPGTPIFGYTDVNGWNRVTFQDQHCAYDVTIYDPATAKDYSPYFYWQNPLASWPQHYSYVTQWLYVTDDSVVDAYPENPVYHYDLVDGLNHADGFNPGCEPYGWVEAPGANSDASELPSGGWSVYQAQTFLVPPGVNRIISAQSYLTRAYGDPPFYYWASIHEGSPTGPQIGPTVTSALHHSANFKEETVCWGIGDVPVTPGQICALKLEPTDGGGCNVWRTTADNYPNGCLYHGTTQVPGHDMVAVVVGIGYDFEPPTIDRSPASFSPTVMEGTSPPNSTFTVANSGLGTLTYSISDNVPWLSVNPDQGTSTGETDFIDIIYDTDELEPESYGATITIDAPGATNTPQHVSIYLTVEPSPWAPCDFDTDGDVDQEDFGRFQVCYSGPGVTQPDPACRGARLDEDDDVDQADFALFQSCASGPNVPADPTCADG